MRRRGTRDGMTGAVAPASGWLAARLVVLVASVVGLAGFFTPFLLPLAQGDDASGAAHAGDAPILFAVLTCLSLVAMLVVVSDEANGVGRAKTVALLGVLVAIDASLRLLPSMLGASPIFLLIILVGAVFGSTMGFQMGTMTLLLSALLTGGIGPWLPFQMIVSGWIGMTAGWLPRFRSERMRIGALTVFGAAWGLTFGMLMNLWFWPFSAPGVEADVGLYWTPGLSFVETVERYARFYVVTSLPFDAFRAIGNVVLMLALGPAVIRLLERYCLRFSWAPWEEAAPSGPPDALGQPSGR
ncbi:MAG: ECF transporter S component [Thermomicrobiales bacterium]